MLRPSQITDPLRAVKLLRWAAFITLFAAVLPSPGTSTALGQGVADGLSPAAAAAAVLPSSMDRSDKWFISVISMANCGACERLKHDFAHADNLAALVNVQNNRQSWSHYNVFHRENAAEMQVWKNIRFRMYPTIVIQPPLSGEYGDPCTVVWLKFGYDGDDRQLAEEIRAAITAYVAKLPQQAHGENLLVDLPRPSQAARRRVVQHDGHFAESRR